MDGWVTACWASWDFVRKNNDGRRLKKKNRLVIFLGNDSSKKLCLSLTWVKRVDKKV